MHHQLYLGGIGCGEGFPGWYTRVSYHLDWINCIIEMSDRFDGNKKKVEQACKRRAQHETNCLLKQNEIVECEDYGVNVNRCKTNIS